MAILRMQASESIRTSCSLTAATSSMTTRIGGYEQFRGDLVSVFPDLESGSGSSRSELVPMQMRRFRLQNACAADSRWLCDTLTHEGRRFNTALDLDPDGRLRLRRRQ
jgi:poly-gamma-glutamate synthesis protein (capsule biosynthesis protein)